MMSQSHCTNDDISKFLLFVKAVIKLAFIIVIYVFPMLLSLLYGVILITVSTIIIIYIIIAIIDIDTINPYFNVN